jgi:4-hydroxy-tetrahydrodipicolinate reductase
MKVGLIGYGKAGKAVAQVLASDPRFELAWVMRHTAGEHGMAEGLPGTPLVGMTGLDLNRWFNQHPVEALVDFSQPETLHTYRHQVQERSLTLVTAISAYSPDDLACLRELGRSARVMSSPNITLGINFLILAAKMLRDLAPFADVEVLEQHFREKPEVSGTARKIATELHLEDDRITSMRMGGIVGHHEVIFGFPHQTVRLIHDSIRREAFGTGAVFALHELRRQPKGFYTFDDLLQRRMHAQLTAQATAAALEA